jgi:hypothetical protein
MDNSTDKLNWYVFVKPGPVPEYLMVASYVKLARGQIVPDQTKLVEGELSTGLWTVADRFSDDTLATINDLYETLKKEGNEQKLSLLVSMIYMRLK